MLVNPRRLHDAAGADSSGWPAAVPSYAGILVKAPLNDERGINAALSGSQKPYILIPEDSAGPDVVAYPFFFSLKSTGDKAEQCRKSQRTVNASQCYRVRGGRRSQSTPSTSIAESSRWRS
jgi:hypothetical protein